MTLWKLEMTDHVRTNDISPAAAGTLTLGTSQISALFTHTETDLNRLASVIPMNYHSGWDGS